MYPVKIIGIYTTTHLLLLDDHTKEEAKDALWLDHDISQIGVRCVGQHLSPSSSNRQITFER
jgi:hypothetical protein